MDDKNVQDVIQMLHDRSVRGRLMYGTTTMRDDLHLYDWLQHLQEELCDAAVYCQAMKRILLTERNEDV